MRFNRRSTPLASPPATIKEGDAAFQLVLPWVPLIALGVLLVVAVRRLRRLIGCQEAALSFQAANALFERRSPLHWVLPAFRSAEGSQLTYWPSIGKGAGTQHTVLDFNQNAGCAIFGHHPPAALEALRSLVNAGTPLRLPLARNLAEEELRALLLRLAAPALGRGGGGRGGRPPSLPLSPTSGSGARSPPSSVASTVDDAWPASSSRASADEYECVLGLRSGAEGIDLALSLALAGERLIALRLLRIASDCFGLLQIASGKLLVSSLLSPRDHLVIISRSPRDHLASAPRDSPRDSSHFRSPLQHRDPAGPSSRSHRRRGPPPARHSPMPPMARAAVPRAAHPSAPPSRRRR